MTWAPVPVPAGTWTQTTSVSISQADSDIVLTPNPITSTGTVGLSTTGVAAGTYGDSTHVPQITIDAKGRILVAVSTAIAGGGGSGTVTSLSVASANGFAGTVASPTTTPVITLQATPVGLLKSDGTGISSATPATDYVSPGRVTSSGITMATAKLLGRTSASTGAVEELAIGGILTFTAGVLSTTPVGGSGTVTSVDANGGTTGLTFAGGPITGAGTFTAGGTLVIASGGTSTTTSTGTGALVLATSPTLVTPNLGTPSVIVLTSGTGLRLTTGVTGILSTASGGLGTGSLTIHGVVLGNAANTLGVTTAGVSGQVLTSNGSGADPTFQPPATSGTVTSVAMSPGTTGLTFAGSPITAAGTFTAGGVLITANGGTSTTTSTGTGANVLATSPTLVTPNLGTPSAIILTSGTGLPLTTGITGLGAGVATFLATPNSANLRTAVTDETGSGALVFATSPLLVTPGLGTATASSISADTFLVTANNVISTTTISYTLADSDNGKAIFMNTTALNTVFVGTGRVAGFGCLIVQEGVGTTGVTTNSTAVTLNSYTTQRKLLGQFAAASLIARGTNTYYLAGMLTT